MTLNEYQVLASRTMNKDLSIIQTKLHALHGLSGEVGEIHSLFQKIYQGHEMNEEHLMKEVGDLLWFIAELCTVFGWEFDTVASKNIEKLMARFPDGFSISKSLNRKEGDI